MASLENLVRNDPCLGHHRARLDDGDGLRQAAHGLAVLAKGPRWVLREACLEDRDALDVERRFQVLLILVYQGVVLLLDAGETLDLSPCQGVP